VSEDYHAGIEALRRTLAAAVAHRRSSRPATDHRGKGRKDTDTPPPSTGKR